MKKYLTCLTFMFVIFFLNTINVQAFSSSDYYNKDLYEEALKKEAEECTTIAWQI